jgi:hypothetical protein
MIISVSIHKNKREGWEVEVRSDGGLLSTTRDHLVHLVDGTIVGYWYFGSWEQAREFVFGPLPKKKS